MRKAQACMHGTSPQGAFRAVLPSYERWCCVLLNTQANLSEWCMTKFQITWALATLTAPNKTLHHLQGYEGCSAAQHPSRLVSWGHNTLISRRMHNSEAATFTSTRTSEICWTVFDNSLHNDTCKDLEATT